jgi:NAD(P)-dependent dehydrogenase (short-subunit alcohol dehydrogenase family)
MIASLFDFNQFQNQVVAVTGGGKNGPSGGVGYHVAIAFAQAGARLALIGRTAEALDRTAEEARLAGAEVLCVPGDVACSADLERFFSAIDERFGRLDVLVNNAGISGDVRCLCRIPHERYRYAFNVHLHTQTATRLAADLMRRRGARGTIVNVGTYFTSPHRQILRPYPYRTPYTAAQAWKMELSRLSAWELSPDGISVVAINPGPIEGGRIDEVVYPLGAMERGLWGRRMEPGDIRRKTAEMHPSGKFLTQDQVARSILAVASRELRETANGALLELAGGLDYRVSPRVAAPTPLRGLPDLSGLRVLVTTQAGPARSESIVLGLAASGARVVVAGPAADQVVQALQGAASGTGRLGAGQRAILGKVRAHAARLESEADVAALFDRILEDPGLGGLDALVHLTGEATLDRPFTSLADAEFEQLKERFAFVPALVGKYAVAALFVVGARRARVEDARFLRLGPFMQLLERERGRPADLAIVREAGMWTEAEEASLQNAFRQAAGSLTIVGPDYPTDDSGAVRRTEVLRINLQAVFSSLAAEMAIAGTAVRSNVVFPGRDGRPGDERRLNRLILFLASDSARTVSGMVYCPDELNAGGVPAGELEGKSVVVCGGGHHTGQQVALRLAREGARVLLSGPDRADLEATERAIEALGGEAALVQTDPAIPAHAEHSAGAAREAYGGVDAWINTSGFGGAFASLQDIALGPGSSWERALAVNFLTPWHGLVRAVADMRRRGRGGAIVNLSSYYADQPVALRAEYTVSKMLLHACAALLAERLRPYGVSITDIQPSLTEASDLERVRRSFLREFERLGLADPAADRRVRTWLHFTIPQTPPRSADVAEAVLFAARHGMQQSGGSIRVSTLPGGAGHPALLPHIPVRPLRGRPLRDRDILLTASATSPSDLERVETLAASMAGAGAAHVSIACSRRAAARLRRRGLPPRVTVLECDLSTPERVTGLFASLPAPDAVLHLAGRPRKAERFLTFPASKLLPRLDATALEGAFASHLQDVERFLARHVTAALAVTREAIRRLRPGGALVHIGCGADLPEATLLNRALEQVARVARVEWLLLGAGARATLLDPAGLSDRRLAERAAILLASTSRTQRPAASRGPRHTAARPGPARTRHPHAAGAGPRL